MTCALLFAGCSAKSKRPGSLVALAAPSWRVDLPLNGFEPASVALPLGSTSPRPIVVVVHGERDRAEWQCGSFRGLLGGQVFIVCPRGLAKLPDLRATVIAVVFGSAVVFIAFETQMFGLQAIWARLGAAGLLFVLVYALPVIALDATLRNGLLAMVKRSR